METKYSETLKIFDSLTYSINSLTTNDLFAHYKDINFIYKAKEELIKPHYNEIMKNWNLALESDMNLLWSIIIQRPDSSKLGTISMWRSTLNGWFIQHLTSTNNFQTGVCAVQLKMQNEIIDKKYHSCQNWFRPNNKYAMRVFATINAIGKEYADIKTYSYLKVFPKNCFFKSSDSVKLVRCQAKHKLELYKLAEKFRNKVYAEAEELLNDDIELSELNEIYEKYGLQRKRFIWLAYLDKFSDPVGAIIAYRGPLGFNLSLLENRSDLIINDNLDSVQKKNVCSALLSKAATAYKDSSFFCIFPYDFIPVITDSKTSEILKTFCAEYIRDYCQGIWLQKGFLIRIKDIEDNYQAVIQREKEKQRIQLFKSRKEICKGIDVHINEISFNRLISLYKNMGFLYPEKLKYIEPVWNLVESNWEKAYQAGHKLLWVVSYEHKSDNKLASLCVWRTTNKGILAQHLATNFKFKPEYTVIIQLYAQADAIVKRYRSAQNWYADTKPYGKKRFHTLMRTIPENLAWVSSFSFFHIPLSVHFDQDKSIRVVQCTNDNPNGIYDFIKNARGAVYAYGEEFKNDDIELFSLNNLYKQYELFRRRYIWMALDKSNNALGAAIVYRGPLGFNFSFLENRCDLIIKETINDNQISYVCSSLLHNALKGYSDVEPYPLEYMPVITDYKNSLILQKIGAKKIRNYNQSMWLRDGFDGWYNHIKGMCKNVLNKKAYEGL